MTCYDTQDETGRDWWKIERCYSYLLDDNVVNVIGVNILLLYKVCVLLCIVDYQKVSNVENL